VPSSGIYGAGYVGEALTEVFPAVEVGDFVGKLDTRAPSGSTVTSVGIEREGLRNGWVTLTVSALNPAGESWAGVYATFVPALTDLPVTH